MPTYKTNITRRITKEEAEAMLQKCNNIHEQVFLCLAWLTGGRTSELTELTKEKFTIKENEVAILLRTKKLKIDPQKFEVVEDRPLIFERVSGSEANLFLEIVVSHVQRCSVGDRILPYTTRWGQKLMNRIGLAVIGLPITPYHFRHTACCREAAAGRTMDQIMHFKGAKSVDSVKPYLHATPYKVKL